MSFRESGLYSNYSDEVRAWANAEIAKLKEENKKLKEQMEANNTHDTTCMCDVCEKNDNLKAENAELVEKLKKLTETLQQQKYEGDDWSWCYGKGVTHLHFGHAECSIDFIMAGGGDDWWNYVIDDEQDVFIRNRNGEMRQEGKMLVQSACGNYISLQNEDYNLIGDEVQVLYPPEL